MAFIDPLNLEDILIDTLAGSVEIFIFLAVVLIAILSARFRMPNSVALSVFALFIIIMAGTTIAGAISGLYLLVIIFTALIVYWSVAKVVK